MAQRGSNRDLFYSAYALEMGLVDRDQLIHAMRCWMQSPHDSFVQVLEREAKLNIEPGRSLRDVVEVHWRKQHTRSAETFSQLPVTASYFDSSPDSLTEGDNDAAETLALPEQRSRPLAAHAGDDRRYQILRPHAQGGLGAVSVALDRELNREVAFKEIQDRFAFDSASRERFVREAEITGRLEHPGIVPVYGLGSFRDGRPFYAMRFVQGHSLAESVAQLHQSDAPQDAHIKLRKLLARFQDVCNAVEYAHSRGIVHRDLKPANIMLGRYGETLLVDWGLAKAVADDESEKESAPEASPAKPGSGSSSSPTVMGSALGTPGYMSPEQAAGKLDGIGPATDIYGLGATLYCLLTGQAPIRGGSAVERVKRTLLGDLPKPRSVQANVPKALEAVCLKAMALQAEDRYASAKEIAEDIERWLADEPLTAYREPLSVRFRRFARRHQTLMATTLGVLLVSLVAALVVAGVVSATNEKVAQQNRELTTTNEQLNEARQDAQDRRDEAEHSLQRADAVKDFLIAAFRSSDPTRDGRAVTAAEMLDTAFAELKEMDEDPAIEGALAIAIGETYDGLGLYREAKEAFEYATEIHSDDLGVTAPETLRARLLLVNALINTDEATKAIELSRVLIPQLQQVLGENHLDTLRAEVALGRALFSDFQIRESISQLRRLRSKSQQVLGPEAPLTQGISLSLAQSLAHSGNPQAGLPLVEEVLAQREQQFGQDHRKTLYALDSLSGIYFGLGDHQKRLEIDQELARRYQEIFGAEHAATLGTKSAVAQSLAQLGRDDEARELLEGVLPIQRRLLGNRNRGTISTMGMLARVYDNLGRLDDAISLREKTRPIAEEVLGLDHPETLKTLQNLTSSYQRKGLHQKALLNQQIVYERSRQRFGLLDHKTYGALNYLAELHRVEGSVASILPDLAESFEARREKWNSWESTTLEAMEQLGAGYLTDGQLDKAQPILEELFEKRKKKWSAQHEQTRQAAAYLAQCYRKAGQHQQTVELLEPMLPVAADNQYRWREHAIVENLAIAHGTLGNEEQERAARFAMHDYLAETKGLLHDDTVNVLLRVTRYNKQRPLTPSEMALLEKSWEAEQQQPPTDTGRRRYVGLWLAVAYQQLGRYEDAVETAQVALSRCEQASGAEHSDAILAGGVLGESLFKSARWSEAVTVLERYDALAEEASSPVAAKMRGSLLRAYLEAGQWEKGARFLEESLQQASAKLGPEHADTQTARARLIEYWVAAGQYEKAEQNSIQRIKQLDQVDMPTPTQVQERQQWSARLSELDESMDVPQTGGDPSETPAPGDSDGVETSADNMR